MPDFTFHNVTITIQAKNAKAAYSKLCRMLATKDADYETDTYTAEGVAGFGQRSTAELWPKLK